MSSLLYDLFTAYYSARKNKRNTVNQLKFEINLEQNIFQLYNDLVDWTYEISPSIYFINDFPVKREIFAWDFRDRIVHHLIYDYVYDIFDKYFIYDSYSCRVWKGTSFGIKRLQKFIRSCSDSYQKDCYILKLDISWYFMNINRQILFDKIKSILNSKKEKLFVDFDFLIKLINKVIFNDPTTNSVFKWKKSDYIWLPKNKSLFHSPLWYGLPIWNLTSQLFSNVYLDYFDKFVKYKLWCKYYGRYVDDFVIIHKDKDFLSSLISILNSYLNDKLKLEIHPKKIYLQHYSKWVLFLWNYIKPYRTYIRKRTLGNFFNAVKESNKFFELNKEATKFEIQQNIISPVNSYLWIIKNTKSFRIKKKILWLLSNNLLKYVKIYSKLTKIKIKNDNLW